VKLKNAGAFVKARRNFYPGTSNLAF
jgi:hypothetical protein